MREGRQPFSDSCVSNLQYYRHDQRPSLCLLRDVALQIRADFFFDHAVVGLFFFAGLFECAHHDLAGAFHQSIFAGVEAAGYDLGCRLDPARELVDSDNRQHDAVLAQVAAVLDDQVFDYVGAVAGIDADAADIDASGFAGAEFVEFQNVSTLDQNDFADGAVHGCRHLSVQFQLAVLAVDGNEIARFDQVDDELQFFLAGMAADVDRRVRSVVVNHVGFAAKEVIDHAIDGLLVAGDDARREHDRVALLDFRVLVIVDRGAREGGHRFALGSADHHAYFFGREILHLPGIDD